MESIQILAQASTEENTPGNWIVFPLQRQKVMVGILGWISGTIIGGVIFALVAPIMIPHNYQDGVLSIVVSTLILGIILYICLGSAWEMIVDIRRVRQPDKYVIIITPEDFVKQEGEKIIHVPLRYIKHVTAKGTPPPNRNAEAANEPRSVGLSNLFLGRRPAGQKGRGGFARRRMRTPPTLAFIDIRTNSEVVVLTDKAYGEPHYIAENLQNYISRIPATQTDEKEQDSSPL